MSNVRYVKQPGYIYDLLFIFVFYYNKELCLKKFVNKGKAREDIDFYQEILNKFPPFPEELSPFFHMKQGNSCLMSSHYFHNGLEAFFNGHDMNYLYSKLGDVSEIKASLVDYFILSDTKNGDVPNDTYTLNRKLLKSDCPEKVKQWVMAIILNPSEYSKLLIETLKMAETVVNEYHQQQYDMVIKLCDSFDVDEVQDAWKVTTNREYCFETKDVLLSVCLLSRNVLRFDFIKDNTCFISGIYGKEAFENENVRGNSLDISLFGKIIADFNRIKILQMLVKNTEMSTGEIACGLTTALPSAYYHLEMMLTSGMLCSRNEGRTVYYTINQDYFRYAADAVLRLTTEEVM